MCPSGVRAACSEPRSLLVGPDLYLRADFLMAPTHFAASWGHVPPPPPQAAAARKLLLTREVAGWRTKGGVLRDALVEYDLALVPLPNPGVTRV